MPLLQSFSFIRVVIIIIQYVCLLSQAFLPGTSLEPAVIPTAQASSFTLQYFPYYVWFSKCSCLLYYYYYYYYYYKQSVHWVAVAKRPVKMKYAFGWKIPVSQVFTKYSPATWTALTSYRILAHSSLTYCVGFGINPIKPKRRLLYLKTQSVPRCKHFSSRL